MTRPSYEVRTQALALLLAVLALGLYSPPKSYAVGGTVVAWGNNQYGQTNVPPGLTNVLAIAAGDRHSLALKSDGTVVAWGDEGTGINVPPNLSNVVAVACGYYHSLALKSDGTVAAWERNDFGQSTVPAGLSNVVAITGGVYDSLALKGDSTVVPWGYDGGTATPNLTNVIGIASGYGHRVALKGDGTVVSWGQNIFNNTVIPTGLSNVIAVAAGMYHTIALKMDGTVSGWGSVWDGGPDQVPITVPPGLSNVVAISAEGEHCLALRSDGTVVSFGGVGTSITSGFSNVAAIAAGADHDVALIGEVSAFLLAPLIDRSVLAGNRVQFVANAAGSLPLNYQWERNGTNVPNANKAYFVLPDVQEADAAGYRVIIWNDYGAITSSVANMTVISSRPVIVQQPSNVEVVQGETASFSVSAIGTKPVSYQWLFSGKSLMGKTNQVLTLTNTTFSDGGDYEVVLSNSSGMATSIVSTLRISFPVSIGSVLTNSVGDWSSDWGDYDNDGRLDLLVGGKAGGQPISATARLFHNDGDGNFRETNVNFVMSAQSVRWGDFDNDGFLDALIAGPTSARISRNRGDGTFTNLTQILQADSSCLASVVDYDQDGRLDISLGGKLYRNLGNNQFTNVNAGLPVTQIATTAWGDYNRDGLPDVLLCGLVGGSAQFRLFHNGGNGLFTNVSAGFQDIYRGQGAWLDFDTDGWLDVVASGQTGSGMRFAALYRNQGDGTFSEIATGLPSTSLAWLAVGDADNDGQPDLFVSGDQGNGGAGRLFHGESNGRFSQVAAQFPTNLAPFAAWGDYDADGRLDLALSTLVSGQPKISLYRNDFTESNTRPKPSTVTTAVGEPGQISFRWNSGMDAQTPQPSLSYNLRVGRTPGGNEVLSANANPNGFLRVARVGNAGNATGMALTNLPFGRYYWAVQTVDSAFAGSPFTPEQIFDYAAATLPATEITSTQAALNGMLDTNRLPAAAWFEWGATTNFGNVTSQQLFGTNAASAFVSAALTNLLSDSSYHYRLVVTNADGLHYGGVQTFITTGAPKINALAATSITASNAVLNAEINPVGAPTWASFEYGLTTAYGSSTAMTNLGSDRNFIPLSQSITGLIGGQSYHYRALATNSEGNAVSEDLTFTTSTEPETISLAASDIGPVSATLNAVVRPNTLLTTAFFEYGTKTNLGSATSITNLAGGTNLVAIAVPINGLTRLRDYYFRVVASNASGMTRGAILSFTTTNDVFALPPTDITMSSATLNGSVNPNGLQTSVVFEYGASPNLGSASPPISVTNSVGLVPVSYPLSNLASNTTYYFRVVATNAEGIRPSTPLSFQTLPLFSVINPGLSGINGGSAAWGDFDNDGKLDLLIASQSLTRLYKNLGNGNFSTVVTTIQGTTPGHVEWGDYNNDGWLDVLITGSRFSSASSRIYRNNGNGTFTDIQATLEPLLSGVARWGDFDRDGRADVLLVGQGSSQPVAKIYRNNGNGSFTDMAVDVPAYEDSHALAVDYDNDGNLDLLLMGRVGIQFADVYAKLYRNLGNWVFQDSGVALPGVRLGFADAGDCDANGFPDLLYGGEGTNRNDILCLFQNNGDGSFTNVSSALPQFAPDAAQWGDYDNDGRLDIFVRGQKYYSSIVPSNSYSAVLRNMGSNIFVTQNFPLPEIWSSAGGWADYDNDGRLDAVITGNSRTGTMLRFYRNNGPATNSRPTVPQQLASVIESNLITFNWQRGSDIETAANGLTHNLRVGRTPGGNEILSSLSGTNGLRKIVGRGNVGGAGEFTLTNAAPGQYYWSIQAIDDGFAGSEFADEQFFSIPGAPLATTVSPTNVTTMTATLRGSVLPNGVETMVHFRWGTTTNLGFETEPIVFDGDFLTNNVNVLLTNLQPAGSYHYQIVASNAFGLATGQIFPLQTVFPPALSARAFGGNILMINFAGVDGAAYRIFASTNLVDWIHVGDATRITSGVFRFIDSDYTNNRTRFYRVGTP